MHPETKRQLIHYFLGNLCILIFIILVNTQPQGKAIAIALFMLLLALGYLLALRIKHQNEHPLLQEILSQVQREHEQKFPGQPVFLFLVGAILTMGLFNNPLAIVAGLITVTYGDSVSTLIGKYKGRIELISNRTLEGTLAGIIAAALPLLLFLPASIALPVATVGMLAEYLPIDDNVGIPVVSALTATLLL